MPEFSTPGLVDVDPATSISTLLAERVARDPEGSLAERRSPLDAAGRRCPRARSPTR
jgi:long-chain acyl-CoA synthetase